MDAGRPFPPRNRAGPCERIALRSSAGPAPQPARADTDARPLLLPVLACGKPSLCAEGWRRAIPPGYACSESAWYRCLFSALEPPDPAAFRGLLAARDVSNPHIGSVGKEIFDFFEKNYEKHLFIRKKIGYNKKTKNLADTRLGGNKRCACANHHSLQSF